MGFRIGFALLLILQIACGSSSDDGSSAGNSAQTVADDPAAAGPAIDDRPPAGGPLSPLPQPPLTAAPDLASEPIRATGPVSTVTEFFLLRDQVRDYDDVDPNALTDADFEAGPLPPVIMTPDNVNPANNAPPFFVDLDNQVVFAGSELNVRYQPIDPDGGVAGMFEGTLPAGARFQDNRDTTKSLVWRPLQPDVGIHEFTVTAIDAEVPLYRTERTIRIKVELPADESGIENLPPIVNLVRPHTVRVNDPVVIELRGTDPNGTIPDLEIENLPAGATFIPHYAEESVRVLRFIPDTPGDLELNVIARDAIDPTLTTQLSIKIVVMPPSAFTLPGNRLRELADERDLLIGYASLLNYYHRPDGAVYEDIAAEEFNFVTTENSMKWAGVNPLPGVYRWAANDNLVTFARQRGLAIHGHTLVWHRQLPGWIRRSAAAERETHMREYIDRVLERYGESIKVWDVVNEALEEDGSFRRSEWFEAMGSSFIDTAFRQARASAPNATLLYNDYDIAWAGPKADGLFRLLDSLQSVQTPLDGVGFQLHVFASFDQFDEVAANFARVASLGLDIYITELDVSMADGDTENQQADVYEQIVSLCLEQPRCKAIQTWGFTDMYSWRRQFTPLLLDEAYQAKPAYLAVQQRLSEN